MSYVSRDGIKIMADVPADYTFRIVVIGDSGTGKTSMLKCFSDGLKGNARIKPTVGTDYFSRVINVSSHKIELDCWDTSGQEQYRPITKSYFKNSAAAVLVYDITDRATFDHLHSWLEDHKIHILPRKSHYMLVGHKLNLESERKVTTQEGQAFAKKNGMKFFETSGTTGENVDQALETLAADLYKKLEKGELKPEPGWKGVKDKQTASTSDPPADGSSLCICVLL